LALGDQHHGGQHQPGRQCDHHPAQRIAAAGTPEQIAHAADDVIESAATTAAAAWPPRTAAVAAGSAASSTAVVVAGNVPGHACSNLLIHAAGAGRPPR